MELQPFNFDDFKKWSQSKAIIVVLSQIYYSFYIYDFKKFREYYNYVNVLNIN